MSTPIADGKEHHSFDVSAQRIARVYAEALYEAAGEKQAQALGQELAELAHTAFEQDRTLESFFSSGVIPAKQKTGVIEKDLRGKASDTFVNFLHVLNHHGRLDLLRAILHAYRELLDEKGRRVRVQVRTALPLDEGQRQRLTAEVRSTFKLDPILTEQVEPDLIGGMVVRVGDWQFDGTLRARLDQLKNQLLERSSYEIQSRRDRFSSL